MTRLALRAVLFFGGWLAAMDHCLAGDLTIENSADHPVACQLSGNPSHFEVAPRTTLRIALASSASSPAELTCGTAKVRGLVLTKDSPDTVLLLNGRQKRGLNALMYPYIPAGPEGFTQLARRIVETYQRQYPDVLLNLVYSEDVPRYDFAGLERALGPNGYDVAELDTMFLGHLTRREMIVPVGPADDAIEVATKAVTINGRTMARPSWLCTEFLFTRSDTPLNLTSLTDILGRSEPPPSPGPIIAADFGGRWSLLTAYIKLALNTCQASSGDLDRPAPAAVNALRQMVDACRAPPHGSLELCEDGGIADKRERALIDRKTQAIVGFSETLARIPASPDNLTIAPFPWGTCSPPLLYADAFVINRASCAQAPCTDDAQKFTELMTGSDMARTIAFSEDQLKGTPPRWILPANRDFWNQPAPRPYDIFRDTVLSRSARPFPNDISPETFTRLSKRLCIALRGRGIPCREIRL